MKRPDTPYADEVLIRSGLEGYLQYMRQRGLTDPHGSLWVQKVSQALGTPIELPPEPEHGDAWEPPE